MARRVNREHLEQLRQTGRAKDEVLSTMAETINDLAEVAERLERAVLGDDDAGHTGLVKRDKDTRARVSRLERVLVYGSGGIAAITVFWEAIKTKLLGGSGSP